MKYFIFAMLMTMFVGFANAQVNYVVCQSPNGTQSVFQGSCPYGWVFIRYA